MKGDGESQAVPLCAERKSDGEQLSDYDYDLGFVHPFYKLNE